MKTINLSGGIGYDVTAEDVKDILGEKSTQAVRVFVDSPGGYVDEAFDIYNLFIQYPGKIEFVISRAYSAAAYIISAAKKDKDKITGFKNSSVMIHKTWTAAIGNADEMRRTADMMSQLDNVQADALSGRMGKSKDEILKMIENDYWLIGWESLAEAGMLDDIIDKAADVTDDVEIIESIEADESKAKNELIERQKVKSIFEKMRKDTAEAGKSFNVERVAAWFEIGEINKKVEKQILSVAKGESEKINIKLQTAINPETDDENKSQEGIKMTLQEILAKYPEANAEYEAALATAKAEGEAKVSESLAAIDEDRKRIVSILSMANAELRPEVAEALSQGTDPGEFAQAELKREREKQSHATTNAGAFAALVEKQTPQQQGAAVADEMSDAEKAEADFDKKLNTAFAKSGIIKPVKSEEVN